MCFFFCRVWVSMVSCNLIEMHSLRFLLLLHPRLLQVLLRLLWTSRILLPRIFVVLRLRLTLVGIVLFSRGSNWSYIFLMLQISNSSPKKPLASPFCLFSDRFLRPIFLWLTRLVVGFWCLGFSLPMSFLWYMPFLFTGVSFWCFMFGLCQQDHSCRFFGSTSWPLSLSFLVSFQFCR